MQIVYHVDPRECARIFVETGTCPPAVQQVELPSAELGTTDRQMLVTLGYDGSDVRRSSMLAVPRWDVLSGTITVPYVHPTVESDGMVVWRAFLAARRDAQAVMEAARDAWVMSRIAELTTWQPDSLSGLPVQLGRGGVHESPQYAAWQAAYYEAQERQAAYHARQAAEQQAAAVASAAAATARRAERDTWITAHGSSRLRKCLAGGYDCQRQYVIERAALEFPGYTVDYEDAADWKSRSGPSEAALDEASRVGGTVVWLTAAPRAARADVPEWDFEECEAVLKREYLDQYDLVKIM